MLTLSDLDNYELKKSKYCNKYFYLFHSLQSSHVQYSFNAFKNYDLIFCNGKYQLDEIKKSETVNNLKSKQCILSGNSYFDYLIIQKEKNINNTPESILIAPSWNLDSKNIFNFYCYNLISILLQNSFKCIFRPHPMRYKKNIKNISKIISNFINKKNFHFDSYSNNFNSLLNSKILTTDNSGIANEFILVFNRPVIYVKFKLKIHNNQYEKLNIKSFEQTVKEKFGYVIEAGDIENIKFHINNVLNNKFDQKELDEFKKIYISNIGTSANFIAGEIINRINK